MKRFILFALPLIVSLLLINSCSKEDLNKYGAKPTWAIPLASGHMTMADILKAKPQNIDVLGDTSTGSYTYEIIYSDTLDPITLNTLGGLSFIPPFSGLSLGERSILLEMFGNIDNGSFYLTDPTIEFVFINEFEAQFQLNLDSTFTIKKDGTNQKDFLITGQPIQIDSGTQLNPKTSSFEANNANTFSLPDNLPGALTNVFEPTPKFIHFTPVLSSAAGASNVTGERLDMIARVHLPLTGYGFFEYKDTLPYDFTGTDSIVDLTTSIDFAAIRIGLKNSLPLSAQVLNATIIDTATDKIIGTIAFFDSTGKSQDAPFLVASGPGTVNKVTSEWNISSNYTDVAVYRDNPATGKNDFETLQNGNAIILSVRLESDAYSTTKKVSIFSDMGLNVNIGLRTRINLTGEMITSSIK